MESIFCQYCGTPNNADARFCRVCGRQFAAAPQPPTPQQPAVPQYPQQPVTPQYPQQPANQYPQQPVAPQYPPAGGYPQQPVYPVQQSPIPQQVQPAPQQPNIPLTPAAPVKKKKWKTVLLGSILGLVGVCAVFVGYVLIFTQPIQNTANDFLTALQHKDYATAYSMMTADVQSQLGSADGLKAYMEYNELVFSSYKGGGVNRISGNPPTGVKIADLTLLDGSVLTFQVDLVVGADNVWKIAGDYSLLRPDPIEKLTNTFLTALQNQDYAKAFGLTTADVQTQVGSADGLKNFFEANGLTFKSYTTGEMKGNDEQPPQALQNVELTLMDGTKYPFEVDFQVGPDNKWLVMGFGQPGH